MRMGCTNCPQRNVLGIPGLNKEAGARSGLQKELARGNPTLKYGSNAVSQQGLRSNASRKTNGHEETLPPVAEMLLANARNREAWIANVCPWERNPLGLSGPD